MPKSLLRYVIAKVELRSEPVQESCGFLALVLSVVTDCQRRVNYSGSLLSPLALWWYSSAGVTPPRWSLCLLFSPPPHFWGNWEGSASFSFNALYLREHFYLLLRLAGSLGSLTFPWKHLILAHHFSCPAPNLTYGIGVPEMFKANIPACPRGGCSHRPEFWTTTRGRAFDGISASEAATPWVLGYSSVALEAYSWPLNSPIVRKIKSPDCKTPVNKISLSSLLTNPVSFHSILLFNPLLAEHDMFWYQSSNYLPW